jgi:hypothetical protein
MIRLADNIWLGYKAPQSGAQGGFVSERFGCLWLETNTGDQIFYYSYPNEMSAAHTKGIELALERGYVEYGSPFSTDHQQIYAYKLTELGWAFMNLTQ